MIDLTAGDVLLTITPADVLSNVGTQAAVRVVGDTLDGVDGKNGWTAAGTEVIGGTTYFRFTATNGATLLVHPSVQQQNMAVAPPIS